MSWQQQQELEIQERIETDPEFRREYEAWLDKLEREKRKKLNEHFNLNNEKEKRYGNSSN